MGCKGIYFLVLSIFLIGFASAFFSFSENGSSINNQSGIGESMKANINISFHNESINSTFRDSLGNSIQLGVLLNRITGYDYDFNDSTNTTIDSEFDILKFDNANFSMPSVVGNFTYQLNFSGIQIFNVSIKITSINNSVKQKINETYAKLNNSKTEIKRYDLSIQKILNEFLNITSLENDLKKIELQYKISSTDEQYSAILENLSYLKIPEQISESTKTNSINFYPIRDTINLEILKNIGGGNYEDNENGYIDAIYFWNTDNLKTEMNFNKILIEYGLNDEISLSIFKFEFDKREMKNPAYFIIENLDYLKFEENLSLTEESGYLYANFSDISDKIIFSTTNDIEFLSVPVFISPAISDLNPIEAGNYVDSQQEKRLSKWLLFGLIVFFLVLIAIVAYIILQTWYRRKYELYLFKNRNNLYNIMVYIQNAKKKGMEIEEIRKNLKKADWTREQINYALRKYEGKKIIGIIEKPFKKVIEEVEKKP